MNIQFDCKWKFLPQQKDFNVFIISLIPFGKNTFLKNDIYKSVGWTKAAIRNAYSIWLCIWQAIETRVYATIYSFVLVQLAFVTLSSSTMTMLSVTMTVNVAFVRLSFKYIFNFFPIYRSWSTYHTYTRRLATHVVWMCCMFSNKNYYLDRKRFIRIMSVYGRRRIQFAGIPAFESIREWDFGIWKKKNNPNLTRLISSIESMEYEHHSVFILYSFFLNICLHSNVANI